MHIILIPAITQDIYVRKLDSYKFKLTLFNNGSIFTTSVSEGMNCLKRFINETKAIYAALLTLVRE